MAVSVLLLCGVIVVILLSIDVGYRVGRYRSRFAPASKVGSPTLEAAIFGLMGLLMAFTVYGAGLRFDIRRNLMGLEANAIGTAYLRLDLLPAETQPTLRHQFREYVKSRLDVYQQIPNVAAVQTALDRSAVLQRKIWRDAVDAARPGGPAEKSLLLSALNAMIDITTVQTVALFTHPPAAVFAVLALALLASSCLAGYSMAGSETRDWLVIVTFAVVVGAAVYLIVDYEYPRAGLVRVDAFDQVLADELQKMK